MPAKGQLDVKTKRKILLCGDELFSALGVELTEDQREAVAHAQHQEEKNRSVRVASIGIL